MMQYRTAQGEKRIQRDVNRLWAGESFCGYLLALSILREPSGAKPHQRAEPACWVYSDT
jgi:hypothetical protein